MHNISISIQAKSIAEQELNAIGIDDINIIAPNTQESLDKVLSTKTLSSMHKKSGNVKIKYGTTSTENRLAETLSNTESTKALFITINKNKIFSYFKLYQTIGHELTHAIDLFSGLALSTFRKFHSENKNTAQSKYEKWLEYRAHSWEVKYAPDYWSPINKDRYK